MNLPSFFDRKQIGLDLVTITTFESKFYMESIQYISNMSEKSKN